MAPHAYRFDTLALHAGQDPDSTLSRGVAVHRTSSFLFRDAAHAAGLFALRAPGHVYSRISNPTVEALERRVSALEGGAASVATSSGTAAIFDALLNLASAGDEIVSAANLYGGTVTMFDVLLPRLGISVRFADAAEPASFAAAITGRTRALFVETLGNPALDAADVEALAAVAHAHGLPLVVDATFTTPWLVRTVELGADVVVNSLTKWLGGHGAAIGGVLTDAGRFDWTGGRHPLFTEPDETCHGLRWGRDLPPFLAAAPFAARARTVPLRNLGACLSPDNAWIFLQGLETLPLRMARHCANARRVAEFLAADPRVAWVRYPGLPGDPSHPVATRLWRNGYGGMVAFGPRGGAEAAAALIGRLRLFSHVANVGDARSLVLHPASTTHAQLTDAQRRACGIAPDLVRLSVGLEHPDDLVEALDEALAAAGGAR